MNEVRPHIAVWARASLFRRFTDTNVHGTGSVKIRKTSHKISVDMRIFFYSAENSKLKFPMNWSRRYRNESTTCCWGHKRGGTGVTSKNESNAIPLAFLKGYTYLKFLFFRLNIIKNEFFGFTTHLESAERIYIYRFNFVSLNAIFVKKPNQFLHGTVVQTLSGGLKMRELKMRYKKNCTGIKCRSGKSRFPLLDFPLPYFPPPSPPYPIKPPNSIAYFYYLGLFLAMFCSSSICGMQMVEMVCGLA